ncbi:MAG: preprotein translocase subunit YajC [Planctomycetales bacterium]|nr:preprotein translocase subunit YajC [Planctomycetales bacterium]
MKSGLLTPLTDWLSPAHFWLVNQLSPLLAQADNGLASDAPGAAAAEPAMHPILQFMANPLNLILISAILFMLLVARPQQKQQRQQQQALASLKKNDRVITAGGVHGVVVQTNPEEGHVTIRIDESTGARMTINRDSIGKIIPSDTKE